MDLEEQQLGGICTSRPMNERSVTPWNMVRPQFKQHDALEINRIVLNLYAERDAAIGEMNQAFLERNKAFEERDFAITQRNLAIRERNDAILERNNAVNTLQQSLVEPIVFGTQRPIERPASSSGYLKSDMEILNASSKTMDASERNESSPAELSCPRVRPRKWKRKVEDMKKKTVPDQLKMKTDWRNQKSQNSGLNRIDFDESIMPIPGCSCTGIFRHCYKWGNGGWQSCCCTNAISSYPLPPAPQKQNGRMAGRKMTGSVFSKLLSRLGVEGFDFSRPVDLKEHWSKHGTNRYITIK